MKNGVILATVMLGIFAGIVIYLVGTSPKVSSEEKVSILPSRKVYTGAWVGGFWDSKTKTLEVTKLSRLEQQLDIKFAIANIFSEWSYLEKPESLQTLNSISTNGWTPMISSNPSFFNGCQKNGFSLYKTIANGSCDEFLKNVARNFRSYGHPILFRFAWEMNHPGMWWSIEKTESTPEEFIEAWRHIATTFNEEGAENVLMVLSFNTTNSKSVPYAELFPGDEYVDWVAIDGYNWGTSVDWSAWTSFDGVFEKSYAELTAISNKPMMLAEFGSSDKGGNKAVWYDDALNVQIPYKYRAIHAVVFFSEDKSTQEGVDWRLDSQEDVILTVRAALRNSLYSGTFK